MPCIFYCFFFSTFSINGLQFCYFNFFDEKEHQKQKMAKYFLKAMSFFQNTFESNVEVSGLYPRLLQSIAIDYKLIRYWRRKNQFVEHFVFLLTQSVLRTYGCRWWCIHIRLTQYKLHILAIIAFDMQCVHAWETTGTNQNQYHEYKLL